MSSFILVPGAMHCAAHFQGLASFLRDGNHNEVIPVELPGLGKDLTDPLEVTFNSHVEAIVVAIDAASKGVVLVGHSTAGCAITLAAEQRSDSVQKLVFLAAETLPGAPSFALQPAAPWLTEGLLGFEADGKLMTIAEGKADGFSRVIYPDASEDDRKAALKLLRPNPMFSTASFESMVLDRYWRVPKAYIKCTRDIAMLPVHQDTMHVRLREGALKFELDSDHGPFISCPAKLAAMLLQIAGLPAVQFRPLHQLCEGAWEDREELGVRLELLAGPGANPEDCAKSAIEAPGAELASKPPPPKRAHLPQEASCGPSQAVAYRISKSRRDSTLAKVLKFPAGVHMGAPACYWYESFVDDPAQYTNSSLNVPERGHEPPLDVAGTSRSLCAEGEVTFIECSRVAFSWQRVVTKVPGEAWRQADDASQVWGIDGREWNGSHRHSTADCFVENLSQYTRGSPEAFWEDVPRKATSLLASLKD